MIPPELEKLLIDWKVAGFVNCEKEWFAIQAYFQKLQNKDAQFIRAIGEYLMWK